MIYFMQWSKIGNIVSVLMHCEFYMHCGTKKRRENFKHGSISVEKSRNFGYKRVKFLQNC